MLPCASGTKNPRPVIFKPVVVLMILSFCPWFTGIPHRSTPPILSRLSKKRHLLPFFPANNTTIVMPAGPFPMMATCLFYFLHAFDKACPDMKRRYRSHCWKCVSVRPCCPAHNVSRIVFHGHTPANSPHSKGYFQTAAAPPAPAGCLKTNGSYPGSRLNGASFTALGHLVVQTSARLIYNVNRYIGEFFSLSHLSLL